MRTLKKSLALVLALVMVLGLGVVGASADNKLDSYTDAGEIGDAYVEAVGVLTGLGIVDGRTDTEIVPEATYNRAEAAKIIAYMLLGKDQADALKATVAPFEDVSVDFWAAGYIAYCAELGIISGMTETTFEPYGTLTGYQWAKMLLVAVGYGKNGEFEGDSWSLNTATVVAKTGLNEGDLAAADHVALRREQAMLFAFNALNLKQVTYSPNSTNYVYDIWGYVFADGTGTTLGEEVYNLAKVEGQIIDNEAMGNANTVVDPVNKWAKNVEIDANTGLDLMYHAVRVWYVDGKTNTGVYVNDLAETTVYDCFNMTAGKKAADKLKDVNYNATIGNAGQPYETYLIDNTVFADSTADYVYVTVYADYATMGYAGKSETTLVSNVYGTANYVLDNDDIMTDTSEITWGDGVIYIECESKLGTGKAEYVYPVTTTEGIVTDYAKDDNGVVTVTLNDGTELELSVFFDDTQKPQDWYALRQNYIYVLDTHGDIIYATKDGARDLWYYTGDRRDGHTQGAWNKYEEYRFINVTSGEELIASVSNESVLRPECYYDLRAQTNDNGAYVATRVYAGQNPYADEYVIDDFDITVNTKSADVARGHVTDDIVYFDIDTITFKVVVGSGDSMKVMTYTGLEDLAEDYPNADNSTFIFNNACFTVTGTLTGHKYATTVFVDDDDLKAGIQQFYTCMGTDKPGPSGDQNFHDLLPFSPCILHRIIASSRSNCTLCHSDDRVK